MELPAGMDAQLLDDFFAEADEHLVAIRQALLQLEKSVGKAAADERVVEELFQQFHSFKGISGIVGLGPAEVVAHASEDFLRSMRSQRAPLTHGGLEALMTAAQKLEQIVAAFRSQAPMPGYESALADLRSHHDGRDGSPPGTGGSAPAPGGASDTALRNKVEEAKAHGQMLWKYIFSPTKELDERGVNINTVREELAKVGETLKATPVVKAKGMISFEFLVAARGAPSDIAAWEAKGVTVQLEEADDHEAAAPAEETAHSPFLAPSHVVRVDLTRLDELMRITGEMVIQRSRLEAQLKQWKGASGKVDLRGALEANGGLARSLRDLREAILRVRLVPVAEIFARMPFVIRDLARQTQKKVRLKIEGQDTAIDKYMIERMKDPLLHLVRNALSHGIETPEERKAAQKTAEATIELRAATAGDSVLLQVRDDGRGIHPQAIAQRARRLGLHVPLELDNQALLGILCSSGFSTREDADMTSGRGVGMAVVAATIRELGGSLLMDSEEGRGTQFTLRLPLTLTITEALIVAAAGQTCAVPQSFVTEILQTTEKDVQTVNGIEVVPYRTGVVPLIRLAGIFSVAERREAAILCADCDDGTRQRGPAGGASAGAERDCGARVERSVDPGAWHLRGHRIGRWQAGLDPGRGGVNQRQRPTAGERGRPGQKLI